MVAPSPRIEFALLADPGEAPVWTEFRPRPPRVSAGETLRRLVWNARWNETLFLVSCAERLIDAPTVHSEDEIFQRIARDLARRPGQALPPWLTFRLVFLSWDGEAISRETLFTAEPRRRADVPVA